MFLIDDKIANEDFNALLDEGTRVELEGNTATILSGEYTGEIFEIDSKFADTIKRCEEKELDDFIFGKSPIDKIVSIEVLDNQVYIFKKDGSIEYLPMVYWILSARKLHPEAKRLRGYNHYNYITTFTDEEEFKSFRGKNFKKDTYTVYDNREMAMMYYGLTYFKGLRVEDVSVLSFDIESEGLKHTKNSEVFLITNTFLKDGVETKKHFRLDNYNDSGEMITDWCDWVQEIDPDVITGHNIFGYDLPYLNHVAYMRGVTMYLGRDDSAIQFNERESDYRVDGNQVWKYKKCYMFGREIVDGTFTSVKYDIGRNYPSWGLKPIAEYEGFVKEDRQFYDASLIGQNWHDPVEREKIVAYGVDDSDDSLKIYQLQISSLFYSAQSIPRPFQEIVCSASGAWLNGIMVRGYLQNNHSIPKASEKQYVGGGMSYGVAGVYSNVSKWDAASYYPSTIMAFQMYDKLKDPKAYYLKMVTYFTHKRFDQKGKYKETGDTYWDDLQAASKVFINSAYGLMGTSGLNFNNFDIASEITRCCRKGLQKCILWATGKEYTHWWNVDETLYKKVIVAKSDYDMEILAKYGHQHEINEDLGDSYEVWVPRRQNKGEWKVTYKHSKTAQQDYETYDHIDGYSEWSAKEMPKHDYILTNIDTDSLSFAKADNSEWSQEEYNMLYGEINKIMYSPWEDDGQFDRFVVVKAKNYAMLEQGKDKMKIKGSSFTDSKKEPALTEMVNRILQSLIDGHENQVEIYHEYVREAYNITDISRWATKKSISEKTMEGDTTAKIKVLEALEGRSYRVGDKVYLYNAIDGMTPKMAKGKPVVLKSTGEVKMVENNVLRHVDDFDGDYDRFHYVKRVYDTITIFETVLDMDKFVCYDLKKNRELVAEL